MKQGVFATSALDIARHGLAVIPLGGEDGKVPSIRFANWKNPPSEKTILKLSQKYPDDNVGVICGLSNVTVIDIDDPLVIEAMIDRFGDTPLKSKTPSGGVHLWYKHSGEHSLNLRKSEGLDVDVKALGGMVAVPPSIRPLGPYIGKPYVFLEGSFKTIKQLPNLKNRSLNSNNRLEIYSSVGIKEGVRNSYLFKQLLKKVRTCDDLNTLIDVAQSFNNKNFTPPLSISEIIKTADSAWKYEQEGKNWVGHSAKVIFEDIEIKALMQNSDAMVLLGVLRSSHGAGNNKFAISPEAMRKHSVIPGWGRRRYVIARKWLVKNKFIKELYRGGKGAGDASQFVLSQHNPLI